MSSNVEGTYGYLEERVLMLLPESRDAGSMPRVLEKINVAYFMCATPEELCAEIGKGAGALLVEEEALSPGMKECLVGALGGRPLGRSCRSSSSCAPVPKPRRGVTRCCSLAT